MGLFDFFGIDVGHVGEEGKLCGEVDGEDGFAAVEDFAEALVAGFVFVDFHPPEEGLRILKELVVEGVLGKGSGEFFEGLEIWGVVAVEGEGVEFFAGEAVGGWDFFEPVVVAFLFMDHGLGDGGVEALAEVGEAEDVFKPLGRGRGVGVVEVAGGGSGRGGDVEVGLEADAELDGVECSAEARAAKPAAEDGGRRPIFGGGAGGVVDESA